MKELKTILNEKSNIEDLNKKLKAGAVIAFVTDTVWGIGCLPDNKDAVDKIYEIKGRDRSKPLILMSDNVNNLIPYIKNVSQFAGRLIDKYFPGALTIVSEKSDKTPFYITAGKDTVGIRVPDNEFFKQLCSVIDGHVLATTSANLSGMDSAKTYEQAVKSIGSAVDIVFEDYNYTCQGMESTVILVQEDSCKILRQGSIHINQ